jgi:hypothetical protein
MSRTLLHTASVQLSDIDAANMAQGALKYAELLKDEDVVFGETNTIRSGDDGEQRETQVLLHY